jgi:hypothetical protein
MQMLIYVGAGRGCHLSIEISLKHALFYVYHDRLCA